MKATEFFTNQRLHTLKEMHNLWEKMTLRLEPSRFKLFINCESL